MCRFLHPNGDIKMSSAPSFGAPGGHIFEVVAHGVKKHVFTAMLAQHVASELRMHLWPSRFLTDRNTHSRLKIDLAQSGYNGFLSYNGYNGFLRTKKIEMLSRLGVQFLAA